MYRCNECNLEFDYPKLVYERHGFDYGPFEKWYVCPRCEDTDYDKVIDEEDEAESDGKLVN